jgi:malonyl-CoA O-methyltransferase
MRSRYELDPDASYALWAPTYPPHAHNPFMLAEERAMMRLLPASLAGVRVLDVGCGSGRYLLHARDRGATVFGVDRSAQMLHHARARDLPVTQGCVTLLPVADGWADIVVCALTLGHVADLRSALGELARVLGEKGALRLPSRRGCLGVEADLPRRRAALRGALHHASLLGLARREQGRGSVHR